MKILRLLILLGMFICSQTGWSQVFGHSGATWVFHAPPFIGFCSQVYQKWEYINDTTILGAPAKNVKVNQTSNLAWDTTVFFHGTLNYFFQVSGDTVRVFNETDSTWQEIYNFSLGIGDTTVSPLNNPLNYAAVNCDDTVPYDLPALVVDTGHATIGSESLRYYTVKYVTSTDTTHAYVTYYERIITLVSWYPPDLYNCNSTDACNPPGFVCYRDYDMILGSACDQLGWFDNLSVPKENSGSQVKIFPNPTTHFLYVDEPATNPGKYMIHSLEGRQISGWMQSPLNVAPLAPGVYLIMNTERTWVKKFIKN